MCDALIDDLLAGQEQRDDIAIVVTRLVSSRRDRFHQRVDSDVANVGPVRHTFHDWIAQYDLGDEVESDLVLAVGEAVANSAEHAYVDRAPGEIDVEGTYGDGILRITVSDSGSWRPPHEHAFRGRGVALMRQLVDDVQITNDEDGTRVVLTYTVRSRRTMA